MKTFIFISLVFATYATEETFKLKADKTIHLILPFFTNESTFEDFNSTFQFMVGLDNHPKDLCIYAPNAYNSEWSKGNGVATVICNSESLWGINKPKILKEFYAWSKAISEFLDMYLSIFDKPYFLQANCSITEECKLKRINIIILTNSENFTWLTDLNHGVLHDYFYFAFINSQATWKSKESRLKLESKVKTFNVANLEASVEIKDEIFGEYLEYTLDFTQNAYNFYIIANESELFDHISIASYLHTYANEKEWDFNSSTTYFAIIERNDSILYEAAVVVRNKLDVDGIMEALLAVAKPSATSSKISFVKRYLKQALETPLYLKTEVQWNVLVVTAIPHWIKEILNDSAVQPKKMLDVYIFANDLDARYERIRSDKIEYYETIDSYNSKKIQESQLCTVNTAVMCDAEKSYWPTGRTQVPLRTFPFKRIVDAELPWYFYFFISLIISIAIATLIAFLMWRRRVNRMLKLKFAYALQGGFAPKEIEETVEKWKKMFIDERYVEVCFENIRGKGSSSIIYDAVLHTKSPMAKLLPSNLKNQDKAVIKIVNKFGHDDFEQVLREVNAALKIGYHKHVCCLLGWSIYLTTHALIYENVEGNDLHSWIKMYAKALGLVTEMQIAKILWQISDGMEHIAARGIVHRDLAARNILVTAGTFEVKITDFGLASFCNKQFLYQAQINRRLPLRWMAPESLSSRTFSEASDVWSFGVLIWELFTFGEIPYGKMEGEDIVDFVSQGNRLHLPSKTGEIWHLLTSDCWKFNRDDRPSFKAIRALLAKFLEERTIDYGYLRCKFE